VVSVYSIFQKQNKKEFSEVIFIALVLTFLPG